LSASKDPFVHQLQIQSVIEPLAGAVALLLAERLMNRIDPPTKEPTQ